MIKVRVIRVKVRQCCLTLVYRHRPKAKTGLIKAGFFISSFISSFLLVSYKIDIYSHSCLIFKRDRNNLSGYFINDTFSTLCLSIACHLNVHFSKLYSSWYATIILQHKNRPSYFQRFHDSFHFSTNIWLVLLIKKRFSKKLRFISTFKILYAVWYLSPSHCSTVVKIIFLCPGQDRFSDLDVDRKSYFSSIACNTCM